MTSKKVIRYYSDCGRGFWKKPKAIAHESNCKCWTNPKLKCCISCKHKKLETDSNGMQHEPQFLETWEINNCQHSGLGVPVHENFEHIRKNCPFYEPKKQQS